QLASEIANVLLLQGSLLAGHLLLAWSITLHARYVLLDAEGELPRRNVKPKAKKKRAEKLKSKAAADSGDGAQQRKSASTEPDRDDSGEDDAGDKWVKVHQPHAGPTPSSPSVAKRVPPLAAQVAASSASQSDKMSKADRKAMKKKLLEDRLKSEQRRASNW